MEFVGDNGCDYQQCGSDFDYWHRNEFDWGFAERSFSDTGGADG